MSQNGWGTNIVASSENGVALATRLNNLKADVYSNHAGSGRPAYAVAGMLWLDRSDVSAVLLNYDDGAAGIPLFEVDETTDKVRRMFGPPTKLGEAQFSTAQAGPLSIVNADALNYERVVFELAGIGKLSDGHSIWLEWTWNGTTWGAPDNVSQNSVYGNASTQVHVTSHPYSSSKILLNDARGGFAGGTVDSFSDGGWHHLKVDLVNAADPLSGVKSGTVKIGATTAASAANVQGMRISCSTTFTGLVRLWGMPKA